MPTNYLGLHRTTISGHGLQEFLTVSDPVVFGDSIQIVDILALSSCSIFVRDVLFPSFMSYLICSSCRTDSVDGLPLSGLLTLVVWVDLIQ